MNSNIPLMLVRQMALDLIVQEFQAWHASQMDERSVRPITFSEAIADLSATDLFELERLRKAMLTADEIGRFRRLLEEMGRFSGLYAGDRAHVNQARCQVLDAVCSIQQGHFRQAHDQMTEASIRLVWMRDDRKRNGFERKRFLPADAIPKLEYVCQEAKDLTSALARTAATLS